MKEKTVVIEQQEIAFRSFVRNVKKLIRAMESGYSLDDLALTCTSVCKHECTDGYESEICNMNRWINLLKSAEQVGLITNTLAFLKYIVCDKSDSFLLASFKKAFLECTVFQNFSVSKHYILDQLYNGSTIFNLMLQLKDEPIHAYTYNWLQILKEADKQDLIPGGSIRDFLNFI